MSEALVTVPRAEALEDSDVGRVARAQVVGVDHDQPGAAVIAQSLGDGGLRARRPGQPRSIPPSRTSASCARASVAMPAWNSSMSCRQDRVARERIRTARSPALRGAVDRHRRHRDAPRHLHDRKQAVEAVELRQRHGHTDDRQGGHRRQHARQVGRPAGPGDQDPQAAAGRLLAVGQHLARGAVSRRHPHLVGDLEALEHLCRTLHHGQVRRAAHDDSDEGRADHRRWRGSPSRLQGHSGGQCQLGRRASAVPRAAAGAPGPGSHRIRRRPRTRSRGPVCVRVGPACHRGGRARRRSPRRGGQAAPRDPHRRDRRTR